MRLATLRHDGGTVAAKKEGSTWVTIPGVADVWELLQKDDWREVAGAACAGVVGSVEIPQDDANYDTVVPTPSKVLCCGLNYASHIREMGRELPTHPTLFAKYAQTLMPPFEDIEIPPEDSAIDWEAELAVVVGKGGRRIPPERAGEHIAGYTVANDVSMRTWQFRTIEWLQGKMWDRSTPLGPELVTPDEVPVDAKIQTLIDGHIMQDGVISDLVHGPEFLISYVSTMTELNPGDVILTGTTGGVGRARDPQRYLVPGEVVETRIEGVGTLVNRVVRAKE